MENKNLLIKNLEVNIGSKKKPNILFSDFSYEFKPNKIYFIMGKSGVGKTTLISYFNGLRKSNKGSIIINNDISILENQRRIRNYKRIRKEVGFLFQYPSWQLCKETCLKDVAYGPRNFKVKKEEAIDIASKCLKQLDISEKLFKNSIFTLSNGQQKRVAIAGVIAIDPSIYLLDEPTAGLDYSGKEELKKLITSFKNDGKIVIIVSHDVEFAFETADEIIVVDNKKIILSGEPYDVLTNSKIIEAHLVQPKLIQFVNKLKTNKQIYDQIIALKPRTQDALLNILKPFSGTKGGR